MSRFRAVVAACLAGLLVVILPLPAAGHDVVLDSSDPVPGEVLTSVESLQLRFTGRVNPKFSVFTLTSADGRSHPLTEAKFTERMMVATLAPADPLPDGRYRIGFQILLGDGDPGTGTVEFEQSADGVSQAAPWPENLAPGSSPSPTSSPADSPSALDPSAPTRGGLPSWLFAVAALGVLMAIGYVVLAKITRAKPSDEPPGESGHAP